MVENWQSLHGENPRWFENHGSVKTTCFGIELIHDSLVAVWYDTLIHVCICLHDRLKETSSHHGSCEHRVSFCYVFYCVHFIRLKWKAQNLTQCTQHLTTWLYFQFVICFPALGYDFRFNKEVYRNTKDEYSTVRLNSGTVILYFVALFTVRNFFSGPDIACANGVIYPGSKTGWPVIKPGYLARYKDWQQVRADTFRGKHNCKACPRNFHHWTLAHNVNTQDIRLSLASRQYIWYFV